MNSATQIPPSARVVWCFLLLAVPRLDAATIWNGPSITFTKADNADPSLPASQDRLTASTWITRGSFQGLYNAATESNFTHFFSPQNTRWANGTTSSYASLSYTNWNNWANGMNPDPPHTVGVNAVVHLIAEDIYLDLRVTSWTSRGGGFSYIRSTPPVPPPILSATNSAGAVTISWTKPADGFVLQQASSLRSPPASNVWATVPFPYQTNATRIFITVPQSPGVKFYRLRK